MKRLPASSRVAVGQVVSGAALQSERIIAVARLIFCAAMVARSLWVWRFFAYHPGAAHLALMAARYGGAIAFSSWVLLGYRRRTPPQGLLLASVALDVALCFSGLIVNPLWPGPGYPGLVHMPETATLLLLTMAASLRLSPAVAAAGGGLSFAAFAALVLVDASLAGPPLRQVGGKLLAWGIMHATATGVSIATAWRTRQVVSEGALRAVRADHAERNLGVLLREHHDVRTLLSSATLNADLVLRRLSSEPSESDGDAGAKAPAEALRADLERVNAFVGEIRERAWDELSDIDRPAPADVADAVEAVLEPLRQRFPAVRFSAEVPAELCAVAAGGPATLRRVLWNLVVNACEGDGEGRAGRVEVAAELAGDRVRLRVRDDGPGFPPAALSAAAGARYSSKRSGSGLGLVLVEALVAASAGSLERRNLARGAEVVVELPAAGGP